MTTSDTDDDVPGVSSAPPDEKAMKLVWKSVLPQSRRESTSRAASDQGTAPRATPMGPEDLPYDLVDRPQPPPVPNGWFGLVWSDDLALGEVRFIIAAQRELVVFRGTDGIVHTLDAHCPHMGAHLGGGHVDGNVLACPYHDWRFDGAGTCVEISYSSARIPSRACVRSYPTREVSGLVLFWFHAGGAEPDYEVPQISEVDDPEWQGPFTYETELVASLQEMAENNIDYTHFKFVHGREALDESTSKFTTNGPLSTVVEQFEAETMTFVRHTYGPGIAVLRLQGVMTVLTATTPIDRRHVRLLWHFYLPPHMANAADAIIEGVTGEFGLQADVPIWRDKIYLDRPLLVKGDGPIAEFRRWYSQFYEGN